MAMDITCVFCGMLPPIISTTPNSPMVWANPRVVAVSIPRLLRGSTTLKNLSMGLALRVAATSSGRLPRVSKAFCRGWTTNGIEYSIEPIIKPVKVNARWCPVRVVMGLPIMPCGPSAMSR